MNRIGNDTYIDGDLQIEGRYKSLLPDGGLSPFSVLSKIENQNLNSNYLQGYLANEFGIKANSETITGSWSFTNAPTISTPSTAPSAAVRYDQLTAGFVPVTRTLTAGPGIAAIGDLSVNRTIGLDLTYTDARYAAVISGGYIPRTSPVTVTASHNFTGTALMLPGNSGYNTLDGFNVYANYCDTNGNGANVSYANLRVWDGVSAWKVLSFNGSGGLTWMGDNIATQPWVTTNFVPKTRVLTGGTGIATIGDLTADRTISLNLTYTDARYSLAAHVHQTLSPGVGLTGTAYDGSVARSFAIDWGTTSVTVPRGDDTRINNGQTAFGWGDFKLRSLTLNGTSGRIASSAGAQTLALDRTWTFDLATAGTAGTYRSVTTDAYGRVTAGTNPTTISGYGITDFLAQTLTGFSATNSAIVSTDTILQFANKTQGQFNALSSTYFPATISVSDFNSPTGFKIMASSTDTATNSPTNEWTNGIQFQSAGSTDYITQLLFTIQGVMYSRAKQGGTWGGYVAYAPYERKNDMNAFVGAKLIASTSDTASNAPAAEWTQGIQFTSANNASYLNQLVFTLSGALYKRTNNGGTWGSYLEIADKPWVTSNYAPQSRTITAGTGLSGGGNLSADRTLSVSFGTTSSTVTVGDDTRVNNGQTAFGWGNHASAGYVPNTRTVSAGVGLTGGGALSSNVTLTIDWGTTSVTVPRGDDTRINNGQTAFGWGNHASAGYYASSNPSNYISRSGISGTGSISYNSTTGVISYTGGAGSGTVGGGGTAGYVAQWTSGGVNIQNSRLYDSGSGRVQTVSGAGFESAGDILAGGNIDCGVYTFIGNKITANVAEVANTLVVGGSSIGSGLYFQVKGTSKASAPFPVGTRSDRLSLSPSIGDFFFQTDIVGASAKGLKYYDGSAWTHLDYNAAAA